MTTIGIFNLTDNWNALLNQLGLSFCNINVNDSLTNYSLIIINSTLDNSSFQNISNYVKNGGAILDCTGQFCISQNIKIKVKSKKSILLKDNIFKGLIDINSLISLAYDNKLWNPYLLKEIDKGYIAFLGFPIDTLFSVTKSKRLKFLSKKKRFPEEEVSTVSKGALSKVILNLLKELHLLRGIPFTHKWFFPNGEKSVFLFREDTDYCNEKDIIAIQECTIKNKINTTWFIHTKENRSFLESYKKCFNDEIALHCYNHFTSSNRDYLKKDFDQGIKELESIEITPIGYAAPYGQWSSQLSEILNYNNFNYSSEFSLIYDSLIINSDLTNKIPQVPIHPICIDSLLKIGKSDDEIIKYFKNIIDSCIYNQIQIALYDHPGHNHYNILDEIFKYINEKKIKSYTFNEYSTWWKIREKSHSNVTSKDNNILSVKIKNNVPICIWKTTEKFSIITKDGNYNINTIKFSKLKDANNVDYNKLKKLRKCDLNLIKRAMLAKYLWRNKK